MRPVDVLVTGGAGFIGCRLARALVDDGATVVALDNLHPQIHPGRERPQDLPEEVELVVGDVTEASAWDDLLARVRPTTVVHLAAETGTGQSHTEGSRHAEVNVVGTTRMTDALLRHEAVPERVVLASSRAVYGEGDYVTPDGRTVQPGVRGQAELARGWWQFDPALGLEPRPSRADRTQPSPTSTYGATKLAQEHVLRGWCAATGSGLRVLRLQNVYGRGQAPHNAYTGIVTLFARLALAGSPVELYEDGQVTRDFVHVSDVVSALMAVSSGPLPSAGQDVHDVGLGTTTTLQELAAAVLAAVPGTSTEVSVSGRYRYGDVRHATCDTRLTQQDLDWQARVSLREGLTDLVAWLRDLEVARG